MPSFGSLPQFLGFSIHSVPLSTCHHQSASLLPRCPLIPTFPKYLQLAMREAIRLRSKTAASVVQFYEKANDGVVQIIQPVERLMVMFINSKSGGRHGPELMARLQELMGEEHVFDLLSVKPREFVQHGLTCMENFASLGDNCAKQIREKLRIVVAGGVAQLAGSLGVSETLTNRAGCPLPPTGIIPLGTENDLSRRKCGGFNNSPQL